MQRCVMLVLTALGHLFHGVFALEAVTDACTSGQPCDMSFSDDFDDLSLAQIRTGRETWTVRQARMADFDEEDDFDPWA
eukprot:CAMPEP_0204272130 /NCGR_PEP_ID=MMETSP0468-20130131/21915_1 /ASSEMBLY_ACC=CAM_ASM_000383 /TAXON_ID=2969 /ORGANISM="Oxyrrhis marina" /LENGTH=78 /DNA_ID=CAMNT_0051247943 /DNA_START=54 /DNA_END=290 /DNA_ORIENTATION=-